MSVYEHMPVMPDEVLDGLAVNPCGVYVDGTVGGGGHAALIVGQLTGGLLVGIDRDKDALAEAERRLGRENPRFKAVRGNFRDMPALLASLHITMADGVLLDLGVSSYQLDTPGRGFSYRYDAPLDMRMDDRDAVTAHQIVNEYTEKQLADLIFRYGEDRYAKRIARAIVNARRQAPVSTTLALSAIIEDVAPFVRRTDGHPAKRVFQALRIEVNDELSPLEGAIRGIVPLLKPAGRLCIITFHSLEDRIVKHTFRSLADPCNCPRDIPYCVCGEKPSVKVITPRPLLPGEPELARNNRAHSAKLRIAEKIA